MSRTTPGPWVAGTCTDHGAKPGRVYVLHGSPYQTVAVAESEADATLIAAAPYLLALAHQFAAECGDCAGTRIQPDDEPCRACTDIWRVINLAEGR